jgi:GWxTD domain-containing protein
MVFRKLLVIFYLGTALQMLPATTGAEEKKSPDSSVAAAERDREVVAATKAYWGLLTQSAEGHNSRVGFALIEKGDHADAKEAFRTVLDHNDQFAPAHFGIALATYRAGKEQGEKGTFTEQATYHANKAALLYPKFAGSHRLLGRIYVDVEEPEKAVVAFVRSLATDRSRDLGVLREVATAYLMTGTYDEMRSPALDSLKITVDEAKLLPMVAQACESQGALDIATQYYGRALSKMTPEARQHFQDISLIAAKVELEGFQATAEDPAARREYLVRFWSSRDPDLMTNVNERQLEHYRRVWYAMTDFSGKTKPWDRRGEVYVRYGPPEYRSTSAQVAPPMPRDVEAIKERIAYDIYGPDGMGEVFRGPTFPIQTMQDMGMEFPSDLAGDAGSVPDPLELEGNPSLEIDPLAPESLSSLNTGNNAVTIHARQTQATSGDYMTFIKWESWVYTGVAGGIEIVFTDEWSGGRFDFAPIPPADQNEEGTLRRMGRLIRYAPAMVMRRSIHQMPEYYLPGGREAFLDFYYDRASFRGKNGKTRVEIYFGLPPESLEELKVEGKTLVQVGCAVALFDWETGETIQDSEELAFRTSEDLFKGKGSFIPNQVSIEVEPGVYDMRVQVKDLATGKSGIYKERLEVEDLGSGDLSISGLQLGWTISTEGGLEKYHKGNNIWVVPMTTKAYQGNQHPLVYYEAYGLSTNEFGQSRFTLEYTIHSEPEKSGGFGRLFATVGSLFRRGERSPEVSISTEQVRDETDLQEFFEMDLKAAKSGVNRLTVRVIDQLGETEVEKEVLFRLEK